MPVLPPFTGVHVASAAQLFVFSCCQTRHNDLSDELRRISLHPDGSRNTRAFPKNCETVSYEMFKFYYREVNE